MAARNLLPMRHAHFLSLNKHMHRLSVKVLALVFRVHRFSPVPVWSSIHTSNRPSPSLQDFGNKKGIPPMAVARMQRWALTFTAYQCTIEHINGTANHCADCMSRLPLSE